MAVTKSFLELEATTLIQEPYRQLGRDFKLISMEKSKRQDELKVFIASRESRCAECDEDLGHHAWIFLRRDKGAICLTCADLDHLVFLPSGDAAVTRRARKHSGLSAVVLKWSRARKHYER